MTPACQKPKRYTLIFRPFNSISLRQGIKGLLVGESALPDVVEDIRRLANKHDEIEHVNEILTLHMGPEYILVKRVFIEGEVRRNPDFKDDRVH